MSHVGQTSRINLGGEDNYNGEGQGSKDALLLKHLEINSSLRLQCAVQAYVSRLTWASTHQGAHMAEGDGMTMYSTNRLDGIALLFLLGCALQR